MRLAPILMAASLLTGCATPMEPASEEVVVGEVVVGEMGNDCAIIAAVAKEYFRFGPDNPPPPVRFEADYNPHCDWSRYGLAFTPYEERSSDGRVRPWVRFARPRYDGQGALIEVGIMHGPLAGQGSECRMYSGFAGWMVGECTRTWVS